MQQFHFVNSGGTNIFTENICDKSFIHIDLYLMANYTDITFSDLKSAAHLNDRFIISVFCAI